MVGGEQRAAGASTAIVRIATYIYTRQRLRAVATGAPQRECVAGRSCACHVVQAARNIGSHFLCEKIESCLSLVNTQVGCRKIDSRRTGGIQMCCAALIQVGPCRVHEHVEVLSLPSSVHFGLWAAVCVERRPRTLPQASITGPRTTGTDAHKRQRRAPNIEFYSTNCSPAALFACAPIQSASGGCISDSANTRRISAVTQRATII